jgi:hypothetical protein
MSLVNDALRRAKEVQQQAAPRPSSQFQFRPVEPEQRVQHRSSLIVPFLLAGVAVLAFALVWQGSNVQTAAEVKVARALTPSMVQAKVAPRSASSPAATTTPAAVSPSEPSPPPQPEFIALSAPGGAVTLAAADTDPPSTGTVAKEQEAEAVNAAALTPPPQPKPAPLKLQAIVFNPKRPSALISGKTVFIGDKLGEARVVAIDQDSAILVSAGRTNVLSLPE